MVLVGVYNKINLFLCIVAKIMKKIRNDPNLRGLEAENKLKKQCDKRGEAGCLVETRDNPHYNRDQIIQFTTAKGGPRGGEIDE
jgi:hypothetical protein